MRLLQKLTSDPNSADIFKAFDADGDGTIDRGELKLGFKDAFGEVGSVYSNSVSVTSASSARVVL